MKNVYVVHYKIIAQSLIEPVFRYGTELFPIYLPGRCVTGENHATSSPRYWSYIQQQLRTSRI